MKIKTELKEKTKIGTKLSYKNKNVIKYFLKIIKNVIKYLKNNKKCN